MKSRLFLFVSLLVLVSLAIVACGGGASVTPGTVAQPEAKANPGQLVVYSGRSESLVQPLIDQFIAETGINVDVRYAGSPELAGVLLEEGANSPADLFFAQDPGSLGAIDSAGMLQPLPESILAVVPDRFRADDGDWVGISGRARVIVYNTQAITDPASQLPDDIYDFIDPEWNGRIGWAPTNASYQTMVTAMRHIWGEEKTRAWLEGILANNPIVFESNTPIVDAVGSGEIDVGFVNHYYLYRFLSEQGESFPARNYFLPGGGPGSLIMVSGAGILKTAKNVENAQRFIEYLLSAHGQQYFADSTFEYPVLQSVKPQADLPPMADLDAKAAHISLSDLADVQGTQKLLVELGIIE